MLYPGRQQDPVMLRLLKDRHRRRGIGRISEGTHDHHAEAGKFLARGIDRRPALRTKVVADLSPLLAAAHVGFVLPFKADIGCLVMSVTGQWRPGAALAGAAMTDGDSLRLGAYDGTKAAA